MNQTEFPALPWTLTSKEILDRYETSLHGLNQTQVKNRHLQFGFNRTVSQSHLNVFLMFIRPFKNPLILILIFSVVLSTFTQQWVDALMVGLIVLMSAVLSFFQEYKAQARLDKLLIKTQLKSSVMRDGKETIVFSTDLVPGDIVMLKAGNIIPADAYVLSASDFFVNQSSLTGESYPVEKTVGQYEGVSIQSHLNLVYKGSHVVSGQATVMITHTGEFTQLGMLTQHLLNIETETEFERGIRQFGLMLSRFILALVLVIVVMNQFQEKPLVDSLLFAIALAVGLAPELLPAILNVTLASGATNLSKHGVLVRRLNAIENLGSMDILCTDKTGTITHGAIHLHRSLDAQEKDSEAIQRYAFYNAHFQSGIANPLDKALLEQPFPLKHIHKINEIPYDYQRKRLSVIIEDTQSSPSQLHLITKGSFESMLSISTRIRLNDQDIELDDVTRHTLHAHYAKYSKQGYRLLGIAVKDVSKHTHYPSELFEKEMVFLGFLIFDDPLKEGLVETIASLKQIGVTIKIITGDNPYVAHHVAQQLKIDAKHVMTSSELEHIDDAALRIRVHETSIFSEMDPIQKERIVRLLKGPNHCVGYLGDGINDAPSLRMADVGLSVENAVDVAKEEADFVLLNQDLNLILKGILEGRKTFANTLKYILMTISANFGNMLSMALCSLFLPFFPLLAKQILMNNVLSDIPALALPNDHVDNDMIQKPHHWNIKSIQQFMVYFGTLSSVFDSLTFFILLVYFKSNEAQFQSAWFMESLLTEIMVVFVIRTKASSFSSKPSFNLVVLTILVALINYGLPYTTIGRALGFVILPWTIHAAIVLILCTYCLCVERLKHLFYQHVSM